MYMVVQKFLFMAGISNKLMTGQLVPWKTSYDSNFFPS